MVGRRLCLEIVFVLCPDGRIWMFETRGVDLLIAAKKGDLGEVDDGGFGGGCLV